MKDKEASAGTLRRVFAIIKLILLVLIVAGIPAYIYFRFGSDAFSNFNAETLVDYIKQHSAAASWIIIGVQVLQVLISVIPGQPIQFAASYVFGVFRGLALSLIGAAIGVTISFYLARLLGRDAMHVIFGEEKISGYREKLNSSRGIMIAFIIYLIPGLPKDLVAYAAGVSEMRFRPLIIVSTIGRIPGMLGSLLLGYFVNTKNYIAIAGLGIVAAAILIFCFVKRKDILDFIDNVEQKNDTDDQTQA